jgi:cysteine synthase A
MNNDLLTIVNTLAHPRIIPLTANLHAVAFDLMKLRPALYCIDRALELGQIEPNGLVVESSSGTMGRGLAMAARARGLRFIMVTDPASNDEVGTMMRQLGAEVRVADVSPEDKGRAQAARLELLEKLRRENPGAYWPRQYDNPFNPESYAAVAAQIVRECGVPDCLVATVGTGGSSGGLAHYLRKLNPDLRLVGVDAYGSCLFGLPAGPSLLGGMGSGIPMANVHHEAYDEVHWVDATEAFAAGHRLLREHTLFYGPTSGAAHMVASWYAAKHPDQRVVCVFPDRGDRYQATVYRDEWLQQKGVTLTAPPPEPKQVGSLPLGESRWSMLPWGRRPLSFWRAGPSAAAAAAR